MTTPRAPQSTPPTSMTSASSPLPPPPPVVRRPPTLSHRVEYGAMRAMFAAMRFLGFRGAGSVGERIGALGYGPLGIRRRVVERQIAAAFPLLPPDEVRRIARASYEHLGRTSIETSLLPGMDRQQILGLFERVEGWNIVQERLARGKGLMMVSGHLGNWELAGAFVGARGVPLEVVARHMANPLFDAYLTKTRARIGMQVIYDDQAVRRVPRLLRHGGAVAFLVDQAAAGLASTWVPFFGRMAKTPRGPAVFALRLETPMVFAVALRQPNGRFVMSFEAIDLPEMGPDLDENVDRIVNAYTQVVERWVRKAPEQYFWQHRRWKHQRPGTPPELGDPS